MRFPVVIRYRSSRAKIYARTNHFPYYRVAYASAGKRRMKAFASYSEAREFADEIVKELHQGSQTAALTAVQSRDALAAIERLNTLYQATGRRVSLLAAVSEFAEVAGKLNGRSLGDVVEGYLTTVATVKRKDILEAVGEFIATRKPLTEAKAGKRAQLSKHYAYLVGLWLKGFAETFPATAVCDLGKDHLDVYMRKHHELSPKSRNHFRGAVKLFLKWCIKRDYLSPTHRLFEADSMTTEVTDVQQIDYFRPKELQDMLSCAKKNADFKELLPVIALGGLAGLRLDEILRLEWADIWRVEGHVEVDALKAKTRSRRLVKICAALAAWLEPYRKHSGLVFAKHRDTFHTSFTKLRTLLSIPARKNGLRHAFCTYHMALHGNENATALQAGNSPAMLHQHYKGLATKTEAAKWFVVGPTKAAENVIPLPFTTNA